MMKIGVDMYEEGFSFCLGRVSNSYALYFELFVALAPFIFKS